jgi:hypothetical protein
MRYDSLASAYAGVFSSACLVPNAGLQALPIAEAERRLLAVACKPSLGWAEALRSILGRLHGLLRPGRSNQMECAY